MFDPVDIIQSLVRCPSVSTDSTYADGMEAARAVLLDLFQSMGLEVEVIPTPKHPVVLAERKGPAEWPHVVIYGHYDVQPPDPLDLWESPAFEPTLKGTRLYGRGVADNKAPMMVHITAAARLLEAHPDLPLRLTFLIEGEEEIGSPSLPVLLEKHADRLKGDFILLSDTLNPSDDQIAITTGIRGMITCEVEVTGPRRDLHSGMYGGAVLNPVQALAQLCASLHDADGKVDIPGFYDAVIEPQTWEIQELQKLQVSDAEYCEAIGIPAVHTVNGRSPLAGVRFEPTLEFNGIGGGYQGEGDKTIIPSKAFAKISCRLVPNQTPEDIRDKLFKALQERCPKAVHLTIREGHHGPTYCVTPPHRSEEQLGHNAHLATAFAAIDQAVTEIFNKPPLYLREGGSIPIIGVMHQTLGMDCIMLGMGTAENNLHAPNESFDLAILEKGIAVSMHVLKTVAGK